MTEQRHGNVQANGMSTTWSKAKTHLLCSAMVFRSPGTPDAINCPQYPRLVFVLSRSICAVTARHLSPRRLKTTHCPTWWEIKSASSTGLATTKASSLATIGADRLRGILR